MMMMMMMMISKNIYFTTGAHEPTDGVGGFSQWVHCFEVGGFIVSFSFFIFLPSPFFSFLPFFSFFSLFSFLFSLVLSICPLPPQENLTPKTLKAEPEPACERRKSM